MFVILLHIKERDRNLVAEGKDELLDVNDQDELLIIEDESVLPVGWLLVF